MRVVHKERKGKEVVLLKSCFVDNNQQQQHFTYYNIKELIFALDCWNVINPSHLLCRCLVCFRAC